MEQNKTAKYFKYAIGEIILVMIGILLALQVNTWNEQRKSKIKEQTILLSLNKEFKANRIQLDTVLSYHDRAYNGCKKLISMFPIDIEKDNLDSISKYLWNASLAWTFNPSQGSINSIVNTSSFDLINDIELRELLVSWQDQILDLQEDEITLKNVVLDHMDPFYAQHIDYDFDFSDKRNNLEVLETLNFEYLIKVRYFIYYELFKPGAEIEVLEKNINKIIEITSQK